MTNMIRFANAAQATLFECELKGQISDGYWENSRPYDHWKIMRDAKVTHAFHADPDGAVVGKNFRPKRKYNFNSKSLVDCVGKRMIAFVKFYTAFPNISFDNHWDFEFDESAQEITAKVISYLKEDPTKMRGYYNEIATRTMNALSAKTVDEVAEMMKTVDAVEYNMKMLRKDLKQMSELVNA